MGDYFSEIGDVINLGLELTVSPFGRWKIIKRRVCSFIFIKQKMKRGACASSSSHDASHPLAGIWQEFPIIGPAPLLNLNLDPEFSCTDSVSTDTDAIEEEILLDRYRSACARHEWHVSNIDLNVPPFLRPNTKHVERAISLQEEMEYWEEKIQNFYN